MSKNVLVLEVLPNYISSVVHEKDKGGNDIYYYRHFDWDKPYCNNVYKGDEFFLINREDVDIPGIYMHGFIKQVPVFWVERGLSIVYLKDVQIADPRKYRPLSIDALQTAMPEFNWDPGPSGRIILDKYVDKLHNMWELYMEMNNNHPTNI